MNVQDIIDGLVGRVTNGDMELIATRNSDKGDVLIYHDGDIMVLLSRNYGGDIGFVGSFIVRGEDDSVTLNPDGTISRLIAGTEFVFGDGAHEYREIVAEFEHAAGL